MACWQEPPIVLMKGGKAKSKEREGLRREDLAKEDKIAMQELSEQIIKFETF